jgi:hypothetical protein
LYQICTGLVIFMFSINCLWSSTCQSVKTAGKQSAKSWVKINSLESVPIQTDKHSLLTIV